MRWIIGIVLTLVVLSAALFTLLFTAFGNALLRPVIEQKINEKLPLKSTLETFELDIDSFEIVLALTPENQVTVAGNYSILSQAFRAAYRIRLDNLEALQPLTETPFFGRLHTMGEASGNPDDIRVLGTSDLADSDTEYDVTLKEMKPDSVKLTISNAAAEALLAMIGKAPYALGRLDMDAEIRAFAPEALDGNVTVAMKKGKIDTLLMRRDFNVTLPETAFAMRGNAGLQGRSVRYETEFFSNLADIASSGGLTTEPLEADLVYDVNIRELALLAPLTNAPLRGPLRMNGTVKGNEARLVIDGTTDIAGSDTVYHLVAKDKKPAEVIATMQDAKLEKLLFMLGKPAYASARLDADIQLDDLDPKHLEGRAVLSMQDGRIDAGVMKRDFNVTLPKNTRFSVDADTRLDAASVAYTAKMRSSLAEISSSGTVEPETMAMELKYALDIAKLEMLKTVTNAPLRGPLRINGTVDGNQKLLNVKGASDIAQSKTSFHAQLHDFAPRSIKADIRSLQLNRLLYMLEQPAYLSQGTLDVAILIPNTTEGALDGTVTTAIKRAEINGKAVAKAFEFKHAPAFGFSSATRSVLKGDTIETTVDVDSDLMNFDVASAVYDLKNKRLRSDYRADIPDLDRLYFATDRHMRGAIQIDGSVEKGEQLLLTARSETLGGVVDAKIDGDHLQADMKGLDTLELLHMLIYPEVLKASMNGKLDYNLESKKGVLDSTLSKGQFTQNAMFDLLRQYSPVNLYEERFNGTLQSRIDDKLILSDLDLRSNVSSVQSKNARLDSAEKRIDADVDVNANNNPFKLHIKGHIGKPTVTIDATKLIEREAGKQIKRLLNDFLK